MNDFFEKNENENLNNDTFSGTEGNKAKSDYQEFYNQVEMEPQEEVKTYKPMSKGIKIFALVVAVLVVVTGSCFVGYNMGKGNLFSTSESDVKSTINLEQKPKKTDEMTVAEVYEKANKSIVGIVVYNKDGDASQASGIVFSKDGYIVTNDHIYSDIPAPNFKIYTYDNKEYSAKYIAGDQTSDLAVLKITDTNDSFVPAEFSDTKELFYGERVVAIGRPGDATEPSSITEGIISALNRRIQSTTSYSARVLQTTCAINPGSSGGALVNMYGQVVGVTSAKLVSVDYDNVGYAIPNDIMKRIVDELIAHGKVKTRAKLGITYKMIDSFTAEISNYKRVGLLIDTVAEDSGLYGEVKKDDIITHINGIKITNDSIVLDIIEECRAGDVIEVTVYTSSGKTKKVKAELKANIGESSYIAKGTEKKDDNGGGVFNFPEGK